MSRPPAAEHQRWDQQARAALEAGDWRQALAAVERAQAVVRKTLGDGQQPGELPMEAHGRLVNALLAALHPRVMAGAESGLEALERAELCWRLQGLLKRHRALPLERPAWLPVAEEQLVRHGALLWRDAIGIWPQAGERALAMLRRLAALLDPCPAWVSSSLQELEKQRPVRLELVLRPGQPELISTGNQRLFNLAPALETGDEDALRQRLAAFLRERAPATPGAAEPVTMKPVTIRHPLTTLVTDLAVLELLAEPLPRQRLPALQRAAAAWMEAAGGLGGGVALEAQQRSAQGLEGEAMVLELDAIELAVLQLAALGPEAELAAALQELERREGDPGFWRAGERRRTWWRGELEAVDVLRRFARELGFYAAREDPLASLRAWCREGLSLLAEAALLERVALWSDAEAPQWLLLPLHQELSRGLGSPARVNGRPELAELQALLEGQEVLYIGPLAEAVEAQWRSGRCWRLWQGREIAPHGLRCLAPPESRHPRRPHDGFEASLDHCLKAAERLLEERPATVALIGAGAYRLPLCRALRDRHGLRCLGFAADLPQLYGVQRPGEAPTWGPEERDESQWLRLADEG